MHSICRIIRSKPHVLSTKRRSTSGTLQAVGLPSKISESLQDADMTFI